MMTTITEIANLIGISRSQIIRDSTKAVALRYIEATRSTKRKAKGRNPLLDLIGVEKSLTGKVGLDVDEINRA